MKILMLTDYFHPHVGGCVEKVVLEVCLRLITNGHEVCVLTLNTAHTVEKEVFQGIKIIRADSHDLTELIGLQSSISFSAWFKARKLVKDFKPDIIHAHTLFFYTTLIGVFLKKQFHVPLVTTIHLGAPDYISGLKGHMIKTAEKIMGGWIMNNSDLITAVSNNVKNHGIKIGMEPTKCVVVTNGVDYSYFHMQRTYSTTPHNVIFIGRLLFNKGPQILIESAKLVIKKIPDAKFLIVGDGPLRNKLEESSRQNNLTKNVIFLGRVDDIRGPMKDSDVYVRPSLLDGMPLGVLESMAAGLPVIATEIAGTPEIITHGKTGHLVKAGDVKELADAISYLLSNPSYMLNLAKNGVEFVKSEFDWSNVVRKYEDCYFSILERKT
jgi:glycosyltransferase involved in cell wall biosynthesis